jgi:16S rRNA G966 N2-methylase RsmD
VPHLGHCLRVFGRLSQASTGHDVAVPFFIAHFFISRQFLSHDFLSLRQRKFLKKDFMANTKNENLLFEESDFRGSSKPLLLNKEALLEVIKAIVSKNSIVVLRNKIFELKSDLDSLREDKNKLRNVTRDGDTITVTQSYLFGELKQIIEAQTIERAKYYLTRLIKSLSEKKTSKINDINLNRWKEYSDILTDSLWVLDKRDSSGVHSAGYWGNFIPQIPQQMMKRYTKRGEWVLDTFAGCGTTLIEAQRLGRNSIGIELQENATEKANFLIKSEPNPFQTINDVIAGDSTEMDYASILHKYRQKSVQLIISHPPYFDIIKFSKNPSDLSNAVSLDDFISKMNKVVENAAKVLDKGRYFALVIGDKYSKNEWIPLGFLLMQEILKVGFSLKSIIIKNFEETLGKRNQKELWRYRALVGGFYIFKHEYIFLFKKI